MPEVTLLPKSTILLSGRTTPTLVGDATIHGALDDIAEASRIETAPNIDTAKNTMVVVELDASTLPVGAQIEWVQPVMRDRRSGLAGWLTVAQVVGRGTSGTDHHGSWDTNRPGGNPAEDDYAWRTHYGQQSTRTMTNAGWHNFQQFFLVIAYGYSSWWGDRHALAANIVPGLAYVGLRVSYRGTVTVSDITPASGTVLVPQPTIGWTSSASQLAYEVIVVGSLQRDVFGLAPTDVGFDPDQVLGPVFDSEKVYTGQQTATLPPEAALAHNGTYYTFVRVWTLASGSGQEVATAWARSGAYTASLTPIGAPTLSASTNEDWGTVEVVVTAAVPEGGVQTPDAYELERWDGTTWVAEATFTGTGAPWGWHDANLAFGQTGSYRARGRYTTGGSVFTSGWVELSETMALLQEWWLRDPRDHTRNMALHVSTVNRAISRPQEIAYPVEAGSRAVVTHTGSRGDTLDMGLWAMTPGVLARLQGLLGTDHTLSLMAPSGDSWLVQPGESISVEIMRAQQVPGLAGVRKVHKLGVKFTEVDAPLT